MNRKLLIGIPITLAVIGGAFVIGLNATSQNGDLAVQSRRLEAVLAESKRLGFPMEPQDLYSPIPADQNAAVEALPIIERIDAREIDANSLLRGSADPSFTRSKVSYQALQADFHNLESALDKPQWQIIRENFSTYTQFPEFGKIKNVVKLMAYRTQDLATRGDQKGALRAMTAARRLAKGVGEEPLYIAGLVAIACDAITLRSCERLVEIWKSKPQNLDALAKAILASPLNVDPKRGMKGELLMSIEVTRNLEAYGGTEAIADFEKAPREPDPSTLKKSGLPTDTKGRAYLTRVAEIYNQLAQEVDKHGIRDPHWGYLVDHVTTKASEKPVPSMALADLLMPIHAQIGNAYSKQLLFEEVTLALIAAVRNPNQTPKLPKDPFNPGKSVQMIRQGKTIRIWSYGPDKVDNGGQDTTNASGGRDIVVMFPSSGRRR